jgi:hypothetical protein
MLAAAVTLWVLFSFWLLGPYLGLPRRFRRVAAWMLWAELAALLLYSYGRETCLERTCAPVAQAAGIAARTDLPILATALLAITVVHIARGGLTGTQERGDQPPARTTS